MQAVMMGLVQMEKGPTNSTIIHYLIGNHQAVLRLINLITDHNVFNFPNVNWVLDIYCIFFCFFPLYWNMWLEFVYIYICAY